MVMEGTVGVFIHDKGKQPIVTLKEGYFFGEKVMFLLDVWAATCVTSLEVKCMLLTREDFVSMLRDLQDLLERSYIVRDKAWRTSLLVAAPESNLQFEVDYFNVKRLLGVGTFGFVNLVK